MAFQMIHMEIGYRVSQRINMDLDMPAYILGTIAPDSVHMDQNYCVDKKVVSHLFEGCGPWGDTKDYDRWYENICTFLREHLKKNLTLEQKSFILGVAVHCFTDRANDTDIWRFLQKKHIPPMTLQEFRDSYYPEAKGIDQWLFINSKNSSVIFDYFKNSRAQGIVGLLDSELVKGEKQYLMDNQYSIKKAPDISGYVYLNPEFLESFLNNATDLIVSYLEEFLM